MISQDVKKNKWICFQIGAREHYSIPYELFSKDQLEFLVTDYWAYSAIAINKNLQGRKHPGIPNTKVKGFNFSSLSFELLTKMGQLSGWEVVMKRNQWFQKKAIRYLKNLKDEPSNIFSYSYAAKDIFKYAKDRGWTTVLGQIDPGPLEEEIVLDELRAFPEYQSEWQPAPQAYWENWYLECELADKLVVNSEWAKNALLTKGLPEDKIRIHPLHYTPDQEAKMFERTYPKEFTRERPLHVLFLGQVILRKGVARIIEAAKLLIGEPVVFTIAGPIGISPIPNLSNLTVIGRVSRLEVHEFYKRADVFLFPTLSDGFALTQLEAFAWKVPILTTPFCGEVVHHQHNGFVMKDGSALEIQEILMEILSDPGRLQRWSQHIPHDEVEQNWNEVLTQ